MRTTGGWALTARTVSSAIHIRRSIFKFYHASNKSMISMSSEYMLAIDVCMHRGYCPIVFKCQYVQCAFSQFKGNNPPLTCRFKLR